MNRAWIASSRESEWHSVTISDRGGSIVSACGHRVYGPLHRRISQAPPLDDTRTACQACAHAVRYAEPPVLRQLSPVVWPGVDADDGNSPTMRKFALRVALEAHPYDETHLRPDRSTTITRRWELGTAKSARLTNQA